jgi:hypothetical protein
VLGKEWLIYFCLSSYSPRCRFYGEGGHYGTNSDEYLTPTEREPALLCGLCDLLLNFLSLRVLSVVKFPPLRLRLQTASVFR